MDQNTRTALEEMLYECEQMRNTLSERIVKIRTLLGAPSMFSERVSGDSSAADMGDQIRDAIERKRQEIMAQAEEARQNAMRQAQEGMATAGRPAAGMPSMMPGMMPNMPGMGGGMMPLSGASAPIPMGTKRPRGGSKDGKR